MSVYGTGAAAGGNDVRDGEIEARFYDQGFGCLLGIVGAVRVPGREIFLFFSLLFSSIFFWNTSICDLRKVPNTQVFRL